MEQPKEPQPDLARRLRRAAGFPVVLLAALILWLEEWLWEPLGKLMHGIGRLPVIRQIEGLIQRAPPWLALACFAIPLVSLLPFKLAGLWLLGKGHVVSGVGVFLSAKVVGTALGARIFALTRPALMQLAWFARLWEGLQRLRAYLYGRLKAHPLWQAVQRLRARWLHWSSARRNGSSGN
ncbi:hypothetical protein [Viridibacterium curvum]|uniref:Transmembrane protein n=1 Tax=Viridibacterium curvum TaxID=1101404 RepID=A0ABP9QQW0_9RHOO